MTSTQTATITASPKSVTGYQGWANWQAWNVALYLGNDEPSYRAMMRLRMATGRDVTADEAYAFCHRQFPRGTPDMRDGENPTEHSGSAAMAGADWSEIAEVINDSIA